jgi:hypothetical protein
MTPKEAINQKAYVLVLEYAYWVAFYNSLFRRHHCCCISIKERRCTSVHPPYNLVQVTVTETFQRFPICGRVE